MTEVATTEVRIRGISGFSVVTTTASPAAETGFAYVDYAEEDERREKAEWLSFSEPVLAKGWDNPKDAQYDDL
jgi:hypothetical protein